MSQLSQNSENDSSEDSEVDNHLEKIHFADLVKDTKSVAGFCPYRQFQLLPSRTEESVGAAKTEPPQNTQRPCDLSLPQPECRFCGCQYGEGVLATSVDRRTTFNQGADQPVQR